MFRHLFDNSIAVKKVNLVWIIDKTTFKQKDAVKDKNNKINKKVLLDALENEVISDKNFCCPVNKTSSWLTSLDIKINIEPIPNISKKLKKVIILSKKIIEFYSQFLK